MNALSESGGSAASRKAAAAEMIAVDLSRLVRMATANEFDLLAYLIDMAVLEAWREASGEAATEISQLISHRQSRP